MGCGWSRGEKWWSSECAAAVQRNASWDGGAVRNSGLVFGARTVSLCARASVFGVEAQSDIRSRRSILQAGMSSEPKRLLDRLPLKRVVLSFNGYSRHSILY